MHVTSQDPEKFNDYDGFVEKFKPKKTTDDCYTPQNVYDAVKNWAVKEYKLDGREIIRPFWPDGDYEHEEYPGGCVVLDNPPFSILSKICRFYTEREIDYFLFAPSLTLFSTHAGQSKYIVSDTDITYENGATVRTGFVTNLGEFKIHLAPDLTDAVKTQNKINTKAAVELPKYDYPDHVVNAAVLGKIVHRGIALKIKDEDTVFIRAMDHQRKNKKGIFGGGFLLSDRAAAEKAAAEKAAAEKAAAEKAAAEKATAHRWELSDREKAIIQDMASGGVTTMLHTNKDDSRNGLRAVCRDRPPGTDEGRPTKQPARGGRKGVCENGEKALAQRGWKSHDG